MKKRVQGLIAGLLISTLMTGGVVFAKQGWETISVAFDNIKIMIDGKEYLPTDADGNAVEPFIYEGTTYLPVRAIANAFNKDVDWEAQTSTVTLGSKNYDWLDQMGYVDYETTGSYNIFSAIPQETEMTDGIKYDRGIYFCLHDYKDYGTLEYNDGTIDCSQSISYLLNGQYKRFVGTIATYPYYDNDGRAQIKFYGDGKLLYSSPIISEGTKSIAFDVETSGIKILRISVRAENVTGYTYDKIYPAIADARLEKK